MQKSKREKALETVLLEFVEDVRAVGVATVRKEWPDLFATFEKAIKALGMEGQ